MARFSFRFKYSTKLVQASGSGHVDNAADIKSATLVARQGVADDFGGSVSSVQITSIKKLKGRKKCRK